jgi:hypothetical protein
VDEHFVGDDLRAVIELELGLLSPQVRRSRELLEGSLDPTFREIGASGRLWSRSEVIDALLAEEPDSCPIETSEIGASAVGEGLVLVTYCLVVPGAWRAEAPCGVIRMAPGRSFSTRARCFETNEVADAQRRDRDDVVR